MAPLRFYRSYREQADAWDTEFARVSRVFAGRLQCRKGCSMCCSQMFAVSRLEAAVIARTVAAMPPGRRQRLRQAAARYVAAARHLGGRAEGETVAPRPGARLTCPALEDDACTIYDARPLICRKWGIPVFDPSKPERLHGCELNFREGEALDHDRDDLVEPQRALLERWAVVKDDVRDALQEDAPATTVAEAILSDPDDRLA